MFLSSFIGSMVSPGMSVYSGTKAFIRYFSQGVGYEHSLVPNEREIDFLVYEAGRVATKLLGKEKVGGAVLSPDEACMKSLRDLGQETQTSGSKIHEQNYYERNHLWPAEKYKKFIYSKAIENYKRIEKEKKSQ